jgi:autotransporter-associated beta strand protein
MRCHHCDSEAGSTRARFFPSAAGGLCMLAWAAGALHAEPRSWDGGGALDNWSDPLNWNPDGVPTSTTDVTLGSSITSSLNLGMSGHRTINSLTIATTSSIGASGGTGISLTLQSGDVTRQDVAGTENNHTFLNTTLMASDGLWNIAGAGQLRFAELGETGASPISLTKTGGGLLVIDELLYTGSTTVSQGVMRINNPLSSVATSSISVALAAALELDSVATSAPITLAGGGISSAGALRNLDGDSTLSGSLTLASSAAGDPIINVANFSSLTLSGGITDGPSSIGLVKGAPGPCCSLGPAHTTAYLSVKAHWSPPIAQPWAPTQ